MLRQAPYKCQVRYKLYSSIELNTTRVIESVVGWTTIDNETFFDSPGSYHPDQYSQYSSVGSFPFAQGPQASSSQRQSQSVPNVHQQRADQYDGGSNRDPSLERRLQAAPSSNEHKRNTLPSRKKLKVSGI